MRKLIYTILAAFAVAVVWAGSVQAGGGEIIRFTGSIDNKGVRGSVRLYVDDNGVPWGTTAVAAVRMEKPFVGGATTTGGNGIVQAGQMVSYRYFGAAGCRGFDSGVKIFVESRQKGAKSGFLGPGGYRCKQFEHPTGNINDAVNIEIRSRTALGQAGCYNVYVNGVRLERDDPVFCPGFTGARGMLMTGFKAVTPLQSVAPFALVMGKWNTGSTRWQVTKSAGNAGWQSVLGSTFYHCIADPGLTQTEDCNQEVHQMTAFGSNNPPQLIFTTGWRD